MGVQEGSDWQEHDGKVEICGITGPMGRCVEDLVELMKLYLNDEMFLTDIQVAPIPFNEDTYNNVQNSQKSLRLGYFSYEGLFYPCKTVRRAMQTTIDACKAAGITMVPIQDDVLNTKGLIYGFGKLMLGGSEMDKKLMDHELPMIEGDPAPYIAMMPNWIKSFLCFILSKIGMKRECIFLK